MSFRCNKCGKLYQEKQKQCQICKGMEFSNGCCVRPKKQIPF